MQIPESRPDLDCRSVTVDALSRQYGQSMSLMLRAFSRENEFICSGVHRPDRTLSMFPSLSFAPEGPEFGLIHQFDVEHTALVLLARLRGNCILG
jgi:hypothetical protein